MSAVIVFAKLLDIYKQQGKTTVFRLFAYLRIDFSETEFSQIAREACMTNNNSFNIYLKNNSLEIFKLNVFTTTQCTQHFNLVLRLFEWTNLFWRVLYIYAGVMYSFYTHSFLGMLAVLGTVSSVDVNSVCLIPSSFPTMTSVGTYKTIYMERVDLVLLKSGKTFIFFNI